MLTFIQIYKTLNFSLNSIKSSTSTIYQKQKECVNEVHGWPSNKCLLPISPILNNIFLPSTNKWWQLRKPTIVQQVLDNHLEKNCTKKALVCCNTNNDADIKKKNQSEYNALLCLNIYVVKKIKANLDINTMLPMIYI